MRRISPTQMQERRENGLYFCDERYQSEHRCNMLKLYLLEGMELEEKRRKPKLRRMRCRMYKWNKWKVKCRKEKENYCAYPYML